MRSPARLGGVTVNEKKTFGASPFLGEANVESEIEFSL